MLLLFLGLTGQDLSDTGRQWHLLLDNQALLDSGQTRLDYAEFGQHVRLVLDDDRLVVEDVLQLVLDI